MDEKIWYFLILGDALNMVTRYKTFLMYSQQNIKQKHKKEAF